jgi:excisionase family DNA binding protein
MKAIESKTPQEAADFLGVSVRTLRRAEKAGELPVIRINARVIRFLPPDLSLWYLSHKRNVRNSPQVSASFDGTGHGKG